MNAAAGVDPEAVFRALRYVRSLERLGASIADAATWRAIAPALTISDVAPARAAARLDNAWATDRETRARLVHEGFFLTPAIVPLDDVERLRRSIEDLVHQGFPPACALLFDEPYRIYAGLARALKPLVGDLAMWTDDFWAFFVPAGDRASSRWTAFDPHRDWAGGDPGVLAGALPTSLVAWVALSDASTHDSCVYVVPAHKDAGYLGGNAGVGRDQFTIRDVRAVPATAGQILIFTSHLAHWGSRSSPMATHARVSLSAFLRRGPASGAGTLDFNVAPTMAERLTWVLQSLKMLIGPERVQALATRAGVTLSSVIGDSAGV